MVPGESQSKGVFLSLNRASHWVGSLFRFIASLFCFFLFSLLPLWILLLVHGAKMFAINMPLCFSDLSTYLADLLHVLSELPRQLNFIEHTSDIGWKE